MHGSNIAVGSTPSLCCGCDRPASDENLLGKLCLLVIKLIR